MPHDPFKDFSWKYPLHTVKMGQQVSRVYGSLVKRPIQRYNVEHRAQKVNSIYIVDIDP